MKVAIIGAGWAGAAAAHYLSRQHQNVTVYEAARTPGGRARRVESTPFGYPTDNGQHILLGAYRETLALMLELGINTDDAFHRIDLCIASANREYRLRAWPLPAPLHLAGALTSSRGFSLNDRYQLLRFTQQLSAKKWQVEKNQTVSTLLRQHEQTPSLIDNLWQPLCLAALNTPIDIACGQLFANIIRDSLGGSRRDTQMLIPKKDMSQLWLETALNGVDVRLGHRVQELKVSNDYVRVDNEVFDACIVATPAYASARLLSTIDTASSATIQPWVHAMSQMPHRPIATVYFEPASPWKEPMPLLMLHENRQQHDYGQWLFNHHAIPGSFAKSLLSVVISDAEALSALPREQAIAAVQAQVRRQIATRAPLNKIVKAELIIEKRATFEASPHTARASEHTPWPSIFLAGDWLQSDYPGVLEGAVRSGLKSAQLILAQHHA